jgi:hypothetical protein
MKRIIAMAITVLFGVVLIAGCSAADAGKTVGVVEATMFVLRNDAGQIVAVIRPTEHGSELLMADKDGQTRATISANPRTSSIHLYGPGDKPLVSLTAWDLVSGLALYGSGDNALVALTAMDSGSGLMIADPANQLRANVGYLGAMSSLALVSKNNATSVDITTMPTNPYILDIRPQR